jgi:hypothetical protein
MSRLGLLNKAQQQLVDNTQRRLNRVDRPGHLAHLTVTNLIASQNATTFICQVRFVVTSLQGLDSVVLIRSATRDPGAAKILSTWGKDALPALEQNNLYPVAFSDSDPALANVNGIAYYWVRVQPTADQQAQSYLVGPVAMVVLSGSGGFQTHQRRA